MTHVYELSLCIQPKHKPAVDRVLRVSSGQNSRTFKYISRTEFKNFLNGDK